MTQEPVGADRPQIAGTRVVLERTVDRLMAVPLEPPFGLLAAETPGRILSGFLPDSWIAPLFRGCYPPAWSGR